MDKFLVIASFFFFTHCEAQYRIDSIQQRAFNFFVQGTHYDSALCLYKIIENKKPNDIYVLSQIGKSYKYLNEPQNAKKYFLRALDLYETDTLRLSVSSIALDLAEIFIEEKKFEDALMYLDYSKTKYKARRGMCQIGIGTYLKLDFACKKSRCFSGLGYKDSAVKTLLPVIFNYEYDNSYDSTEYDKISQFFANTVFDVYGKENARNMMLQSVQNIFYRASKKLENKARPLTFNIECYLYFLNFKIDLGSDSYSDFEKDEPVPEILSKEVILKTFTSSLPYYYITHQPTLFTSNPM